MIRDSPFFFGTLFHACHFPQSPREWKAWFLSGKPEESPLPQDWENKCSDLQRLCVLRSLRPDRILFSASTYVSNNLGPQFADPPTFDLKVCRLRYSTSPHDQSLYTSVWGA